MANSNSENSGPRPSEASGAAREAVLSVRESSGPTRGVALVLHGGKSQSREPVEARHLSPARMVPFAWDLHRAGRKHGLAVWSLRNSVRGWNGPDMSPLQDARWALARIREQHPGVPVFLVGHSMGGLTALCAADHPGVEAVVALAPWLNPTTPTSGVANRKVLIVHGTTDRWTSASASLLFARRASAEAASMQYVALKGAGHFMLRKIGVWQTLTTGFVMKAFSESIGRELPLPADFSRLLPESSVQVTL
jgi:alpha-beta hydrolase superfamily lysophospholipase